MREVEFYTVEEDGSEKYVGFCSATSHVGERAKERAKVYHRAVRARRAADSRVIGTADKTGRYFRPSAITRKEEIRRCLAPTT